MTSLKAQLGISFPFLLLFLLLSSTETMGQGMATLKIFPPTCYDCCNGRVIVIDVQDCGIPEFQYDWQLSEDQILSADSVIDLCTGYSSFVVQDASNEVDTIDVYLRSRDEIYEEEVTWSCFDSSYYSADIQFQAVVTHADTRDTLAGSEVHIYQEEKLFTRLITPISDNFSTLLPLGHLYRLEFSRDGFFTKTLIIDTKEFDPWKVGAGFSIDTGVSMIEIEEGLDMDILTDPIGFMSYDEESDNFKWDWEYTARMKEEIDVRLQDFRSKRP